MMILFAFSSMISFIDSGIFKNSSLIAHILSSQYVSLDSSVDHDILCHACYMSEIKDDAEDAGESMKRGAKKTGNGMKDGAEEAKEKVDYSFLIL